MVRLEASGVEIGLVALAKVCLAAQVERRPRNAGVVVERVTTYLAGVQERLRSAELERVASLARAGEETKRRAISDELAHEARARAEEAQARVQIERSRRRRTVALAASVLVTFGVVGGGWAHLTRQRAARLVATNRVVSDALADAEVLRGRARTAALGDLTLWLEAVSAAKHARDLLAQGEPDRTLQQRVDATLTGVEQEHAAAKRQVAELERVQKLLTELETIRGNRSEHWDANQSDREYAAAFRTFGMDFDQLDPKEAGNQIAQRSQPVELASYLDDWALQRRKAHHWKDEASWRRLLAAATAGDPDPWRVALREQIGRSDHEALRRLAGDEKKLEAQSPPSVVLLAAALVDQGDRKRAEWVLQRAWRRKPDDFWVGHALGVVHVADGSYDKPDEAARYLSVAVAIRPRSSVAHDNLGVALGSQGKLEEAIAEFREALRLEPENSSAHNNLGFALQKHGKLEEAIDEYREALQLNPDFFQAHLNLGKILCEHKHDYDGEIAEYHEALRVKPDDPGAHYDLGKALTEKGKLDEGVTEYREALRLKPDYAEAHCNLGDALRQQGRFAEALVEVKRGHELGSKNPNWRYPSSEWLRECEHLVELDHKLPAILTGKAKPSNAAETLGFAQLCYDKKLHGASARFWLEALQSQPKLADDMQVQHRYNAACAAALAGCGQGKDEPPLDDAAKSRWRKRAMDWLSADLAAWSKILESGPPQARQFISQTLQHWKVDTDLAGIRESAALAKLPAHEQKTCRALWTQVDTLLAKSSTAKSAQGR